MQNRGHSGITSLGVPFLSICKADENNMTEDQTWASVIVIAIICGTFLFSKGCDIERSKQIDHYDAMQNCQNLKGTWDSTWRICYITRIEEGNK